MHQIRSTTNLFSGSFVYDSWEFSGIREEYATHKYSAADMILNRLVIILLLLRLVCGSFAFHSMRRPFLALSVLLSA